MWIKKYMYSSLQTRKDKYANQRSTTRAYYYLIGCCNSCLMSAVANQHLSHIRVPSNHCRHAICECEDITSIQWIKILVILILYIPNNSSFGCKFYHVLSMLSVKVKLELIINVFIFTIVIYKCGQKPLIRDHHRAICTYRSTRGYNMYTSCLLSILLFFIMII